ncbi:MAG: hypothetical protein JJE22_00625 [Bacteroidia bacterium]|nr:hypothetical protein [Bacteroidia bacterium]
MKQIMTVMSTMALFTFLSCNNDSEKKAEDAPATMAASSFQVMMVQFPVSDYAKFNAVYNANDSLRQAYSISKYYLGRGLDDSNKVFVLERIAGVEQAKNFSEAPALKEAMGNGGVAGPPAFDFVNVVRNDDSKIDYMDRIMVKHHVKDYAAWLKVYDEEGMKTRLDNGLMDRGIGRAIEDSNMVYVVFAVTDMAKAKARVNSEELKKVMTDAGVEGPPEVVMYKVVE